jgi:hypothetical protein
MNYLFDDTVTSRVIVTRDNKSGKYKASVALVGAGEGWSTYSTGDTPQVAVTRALQNAEIPERWRQMRFF